jgi:hypothetical protein
MRKVSFGRGFGFRSGCGELRWGLREERKRHLRSLLDCLVPLDSLIQIPLPIPVLYINIPTKIPSDFPTRASASASTMSLAVLET